MKQVATFFSTVLACASVLAHEGHGMGGAHWHASDSWGFIAVGGIFALALWLSRGGK